MALDSNRERLSRRTRLAISIAIVAAKNHDDARAADGIE
jgi:hypothetical protein